MFLILGFSDMTNSPFSMKLAATKLESFCLTRHSNDQPIAATILETLDPLGNHVHQPLPGIPC